MLVTNQTSQDYWFGPLHLDAGEGSTLTVDDTTENSLYLTNDSVADALNNLYLAGKITVSSAALPFPRPTGMPQVIHGDGSPEGLHYAPQGSIYLRRDNNGTSDCLYTKTTGITTSTGWETLGAAGGTPAGSIQQYAGATAPDGWLVCDGSAVSRTTYANLFAVTGTTYGGGDGSTTFNLPDLRGRIPVGYAASGGNPDISTLGSSDGLTESARSPLHAHSVSGSPSLTGSVGFSDPGHGHSGSYVPVYADTNPSGTSAFFAQRSDGATLLLDATMTVAGNTTGISVSNGTLAASKGTLAVGVTGRGTDAPSYLVVNHIIKT